MPDWSKEIRSALERLNLEPTREHDVIEELSQHLDDRYEELLAKGVNAQQAYQTLHAELEDGRLSRELKSIIRKAHEPLSPGSSGPKKRLFGGLGRDLRYAVRQLRQSPAFAAVAILSLALGIGANTAIFQLLDAVRMRLLPVKAPEQLAAIRIANDGKGRTGNFFSNNSDLTSSIWNRLHSQQQGFSGVAAWSAIQRNLSQGGEARNANTLMVSGDFFSMLGIRPVLGRLLSPADDYRGCGTQGAVLSYAFWQSEFGGRESALGSKLTLDRQIFQVIGVTPPSFHGVDIGKDFDAAVALCSETAFEQKDSWSDDPQVWWLAVLGRLKPGWTIERASAQLAAISPGIFTASLPPKYDSINKANYLTFRLGATRADKGVSDLRRSAQNPLYILLALSALVLLLACTNLANLLLARATARQREMALRLTLGASRLRLTRQVLAESLLLAVLGTAVGVGLAQLLSRGLITMLGSGRNPVILDMSLDWRVLSFAAGLAGITCILFGLTPALQAFSTDPGSAMKANGRSTTAGREHFLLRRILIVTQVALALVLLSGALLFARSFRNLLALNAGFEQDHILTAEFNYSALHLPQERRPAFQKDLLDRVSAIPGVQSVASTFIVPISHSGWDDNIDVPGGPQRQTIWFNSVSPSFFQTLRIPLVSGRDFNDLDTPTSPRVAVVSETFARKFFQGANPVGKIVTDSGKPDKTYQIIGMVKDMKYQNLREDFLPILFVSSTQDKDLGEGVTLMIRSNDSMESLASAVKRVAADVNPSMVLTLSIFRTEIKEDLSGERLMANLTGFFGALAIILAIVGIYGVISYMVARRKGEIGVRMALGAARRNILVMIVREAFILLGIGTLIGTAIAIAVGVMARSMLFGLKAYDPVILGSSILGLAVIVILSSLLPARRAASIDPMVVLREE
ncbi:ABC transporter permease [Acidobacterium sp. S8]|uniref:ABC transporter permease n=1 Tax=Acidobacterium sp. S8 TaxID=1641854 RepID=UPI00131E1B91|nr:ABC transporter permease [Acidobacterium sp. S8]